MTTRWTEEQYFPLSAINHYSFCPRRCALVHLEQAWEENIFTASGKVLHEKTDAGDSESRRDHRIVRSLRISSSSLGVSGIMDVVEFFRDDGSGVPIAAWPGKWRPCPVEYKRGSAKNDIPYKRQLCAQAICLEEQFSARIAEGFLYKGVSRHRELVPLDEALRRDTRAVCEQIHALLECGNTPSATLGSHCKSCSLVEVCLPDITGRSARRWLARQVEEILSAENNS